MRVIDRVVRVHDRSAQADEFIRYVLAVIDLEDFRQPDFPNKVEREGGREKLRKYSHAR